MLLLAKRGTTPVKIKWFNAKDSLYIYLYTTVDILSSQAEERLGDPLQGPEQTQQDTLWQIVKNDHTPQSTTFDTSKVDFTKNLHGVKHGKTTKATEVSVRRGGRC